MEFSVFGSEVKKPTNRLVVARLLTCDGSFIACLEGVRLTIDFLLVTWSELSTAVLVVIDLPDYLRGEAKDWMSIYFLFYVVKVLFFLKKPFKLYLMLVKEVDTSQTWNLVFIQEADRVWSVAYELSVPTLNSNLEGKEKILFFLYIRLDLGLSFLYFSLRTRFSGDVNQHNCSEIKRVVPIYISWWAGLSIKLHA